MKMSEEAEIALAAIRTAMQVAQEVGDWETVGSLATQYYAVCAKDQGALV
jgi:hypothetical protein